MCLLFDSSRFSLEFANLHLAAGTGGKDTQVMIIYRLNLYALTGEET